MNEKYKNFGLTLIIILLVISLGFFAINQFLKFKYNSAFLQTPCELCDKLNPKLNVKECLYPTKAEKVEDIQKLNITNLAENFKVV